MDGEADDGIEPGGPVRTVEAGGIDDERFLAVLHETVRILEDEQVPHVLMGGLAVAALARPRWTHDIDIFLRLDDARRAMTALGEAGYETETTDHLWLYKATKDDVLVDLIFRSEGNIYFDDDMEARAVETDFKGERVRVMPPEDLIVTKAAAHQEDGGYHWFDAMSLLGTCDLDWDYLLHRSRHAVRRMLSLLLYAQSSDIAVPDAVIDRFYAKVFGAVPDTAGGGADDGSVVASERGHDAEDRRSRLLSDDRVADLDVGVEVYGETILLTGEVPTEERRTTIGAVADELWPQHRIDNRVALRRPTGGGGVEDLS